MELTLDMNNKQFSSLKEITHSSCCPECSNKLDWDFIVTDNSISWIAECCELNFNIHTPKHFILTIEEED